MTAPVALIPYCANAFTEAASSILDHYRDSLPDLSQCCIVLPDLNGAATLRHALLTQAYTLGYHALLGPKLHTLEDWLSEQAPLSKPVLSPAAQELVLVEAIRHSKQLFNAHDPWLLTGELLNLFAELTLARTPLENFDDFTDILRTGYGIKSDPPEPFTHEARIVFMLWQAWQQQLKDDDFLDAATALLTRLANSLMTRDSQDMLWFIGFNQLSTPYITWLQQLLNSGRARLFIQSSQRPASHQHSYHPDTPINRLLQQLDCPVDRLEKPVSKTSLLLDTLFALTDAPLQERAREFTERYPDSPLKQQFFTLHTKSAEQEARAVALQVRLWLLEDKHSIGIITEDRRLARRIRALLERDNIALQDTGGWALSTTSAAAVLERWLQTVEEDFAHDPLLDILKSPFICLLENRQHHLHTVRRFEQDIVLHENIARNLEQYRKHLALRAERLPDWSETTRHDIDQLLNQLDHAAEPLRKLLNNEHPVADYTAALQLSLQALSLDKNLAADPAGERILEELTALHAAAEICQPLLTWQEFRAWLGRTLERFTFQPATNQSAIRLMALGQCHSQNFDAAILAGCTADQLPGKPGTHAFFNQSVRAELGLPTWQDTLYTKLHQFRCALESAPHLLITCCDEQNGEPVPPTPWLELIETFHDLAYAQPLHPTELEQQLHALASQTVMQPANTDAQTRPRPAPKIDPQRLPKYWTASAHQRLIDCPYRFFAADILKLTAQEEIREALEKADYGEYVHLILQAFHSDVKGLPGPWQGALSSSQRQSAITLLDQISEAVFHKAVTENLIARGWLKRWQAYIPAYIDWSIERQTHWQPQHVEQRLQQEGIHDINFKGRVDRIDRAGSEQAIIDYKTGATPSIETVNDGEAVQLPSYALLSDKPISRVEYVKFDKNAINNSISLEGNALDQLVEATKLRLSSLVEMIGQGDALPAWGDPSICQYCEFDGLCRRDSWQHDVE